jgi:hypothetical protein
MKFLFVHNNFPAQFRNLVEELGKSGSYEIAAIGAQTAQAVEGVAVHRYQVPTPSLLETHPFARHFDAECWRAEQVLMAASALAASGFFPDFILAHCGWGETLPLRAIFPKAKFIIYCEFFYRAEGQDVHFDPESPRLGVDGLAFPFHDRSALSEAVVGALANRGHSSRHGAAARKTVAERFDKKVCAREALRAMAVDEPRHLVGVGTRAKPQLELAS